MAFNIKCYDNGGKSFDQYTVVYLDYPQDKHGVKYFDAVAMSANPFHPQGFGQHTLAQIGEHLGKEIYYNDLPPDCQKLVWQDLSGENDGNPHV
jgi:hypothetical protein